MKKKYLNKEYLAPIYAWALGDSLEIPPKLGPELRDLHHIIYSCKLKPRDPATHERDVLRLIKAVCWLKWVHENPDDRQGDSERISRLTAVIYRIEKLDLSDVLNLEAYFDRPKLIEQFKQACTREREYLKRPFQLLILETLASIYPFLTSYKLSMSKGSAFMKLVGEIDRYVTGRIVTNPAECMADCAKKYKFDIEKYRLLEQYVTE